MTFTTAMRTTYFLLISLFAGTAIFADVIPNGMFTDNMVLQRDQKVLVYGQADEHEKVQVSINGQSASTEAADGKWQVALPPMPAGGPYQLEIRGRNTILLNNVMVGDVWVLGGQSNMARRFNTFSWLMERLPELEENDLVRMFKVRENSVSEQPGDQLMTDPRFKNSWQPCTHELVEVFSPLGYFFAIDYQKQTGIAVGVIHAARGATMAESWVPIDVLKSRTEYAQILDPSWNRAYEPESDGSPKVTQPALLYNGTVHPLMPYTIKGVLWNQGESDSRYSKRYRTLFPDLIRSWRKEWGQGDFPFIFAQLSSYEGRQWSVAFEPDESAWAWEREAQACGLDEPNTAMVAAHDIGEWGDIHPQDKETLAKRYVLAALKLDGRDVIAEGPLYKSSRIEGNRVIVSFDNLYGGLESRRVAMNKQKGFPPGKDPEAFVAKADKLTGFTICGPDRVFHKANARIVGDEVEVWSNEVPEPVAVRYAWATFALANLYSKAGLPAFPFRTDNFPQVPIVREDRPNVILIMTDDQGYGDFGFTGNPIIRTPNLDAMAGRSASMEQFYVSPVCAPTRASLMTGRYNFRTRVIDTWNGHAMMDPDETTIAEILRDAGYATGLFGKWHLGDNYPLRPEDQGFEEVLMHLGGGIGQPSDPEGAEGAYTNPTLVHNGQLKPFKGYCTDVFFDHAKSWMAKSKKSGRPFFAYIPTNAPHGPFHDVPEALYQSYRKMDLRDARFSQDKGHPLTNREDLDQRARIYAMIENVDDNIGSLFQFLEELDIIDNTLVIFLVDNGPNGKRYVGGFNGSKTDVREGGIRSPVLFHWPEHFVPGATSDRISAHIDIAPTILEACSVPSGRINSMDGRSLWPLLTGQDTDWPDRSIVIQAHRGTSPVLYHNFAIRNQRWKLLHPSGFQSENFSGTPKFELYDMQADPFEEVNLVDKRADVVAILKKQYLEWFADVGNSRPDNYLAPRIHLDPDQQHPLILNKQDAEHYNGPPFKPTSMAVWRLHVDKPFDYLIRFRFSPLQEKGTAVLKLNGRTLVANVAPGDTEVLFSSVQLNEGPLDLLPYLSVGNDLFSPWKVDLLR